MKSELTKSWSEKAFNKCLFLTNYKASTIKKYRKLFDDIKKFMHLESKITTIGDWDTKVNTRLSKANKTFVQLKPIWRSTRIIVKTKLCQ